MAHQSHAPDTTFIVNEPDFVFFNEHGEEHLRYLSEQEASLTTYTRFEDMAGLLSPEAADAFRAELAVYLEKLKDDKTAPWPKESVQEPRTREERGMRWTVEAGQTLWGPSRPSRARANRPRRDSSLATSAGTCTTCRR